MFQLHYMTCPLISHVLIHHEGGVEDLEEEEEEIVEEEEEREEEGVGVEEGDEDKGNV